MKRYAVIGNPIAHSLSPEIHRLFAVQTGILLSYEKIQPDALRFEEHVQAFFAEGGLGLNVTVPFKREAFRLCAHVTPRAAKAKAVNTLWMLEGLLYGDNTDGVGFIRDLSSQVDKNWHQSRILLLGAGGAARGILGPLLALKPQALVVSNRTLTHAKALELDFPGIEVKTLAEIQAPYDLIIHATSLSHEDYELSAPLLSIFHAQKAKPPYCYDLSYSRSHDTPFVIFAREQGASAVDGFGMLVEQAAEAFYIWHNMKPDPLAVKQRWG